MSDTSSNADQSLVQKGRGVLGSRSGTERIPPFGLAVLTIAYLLVGGYLLVQGLLAGNLLGNLVRLGAGIGALVLAFGLWNRRFWAGTVVAVFHMLYVVGSLVQGGLLAFVGPVVSVIVVAYVWHVPDDVWE